MPVGGNGAATFTALMGWHAFRRREASRFVSRGRDYTEGYLSAFGLIGKIWKLSMGCGTYYGARDAMKHFKFKLT